MTRTDSIHYRAAQAVATAASRLHAAYDLLKHDPAKVAEAGELATVHTTLVCLQQKIWTNWKVRAEFSRETR